MQQQHSTKYTTLQPWQSSISLDMFNSQRRSSFQEAAKRQFKQNSVKNKSKKIMYPNNQSEGGRNKEINKKFSIANIVNISAKNNNFELRRQQNINRDINMIKNRSQNNKEENEDDDEDQILKPQWNSNQHPYHDATFIKTVSSFKKPIMSQQQQQGTTCCPVEFFARKGSVVPYAIQQKKQSLLHQHQHEYDSEPNFETVNITCFDINLGGKRQGQGYGQGYVNFNPKLVDFCLEGSPNRHNLMVQNIKIQPTKHKIKQIPIGRSRATRDTWATTGTNGASVFSKASLKLSQNKKQSISSVSLYVGKVEDQQSPQSPILKNSSKIAFVQQMFKVLSNKSDSRTKSLFVKRQSTKSQNSNYDDNEYFLSPMKKFNNVRNSRSSRNLKTYQQQQQNLINSSNSQKNQQNKNITEKCVSIRKELSSKIIALKNNNKTMYNKSSSSCSKATTAITKTKKDEKTTIDDNSQHNFRKTLFKRHRYGASMNLPKIQVTNQDLINVKGVKA